MTDIQRLMTKDCSQIDYNRVIVSMDVNRVHAFVNKARAFFVALPAI